LGPDKSVTDYKLNALAEAAKHMCDNIPGIANSIGPKENPGETYQGKSSSGLYKSV
jgi:hypothetical protein